MTARDRVWIAVLAAAFAFGIAASWHRWAGPVIDSGREMNQPLRLAGGEMLYSQVGHIYGPLSPYLHAALYRVFGPSLSVLYIDGMVSALAILALVYLLARRIVDPDASAVATLTVMWLCTFKPAGNYIFPYAYSALHGTLFALITLAIAAGAVPRPAAARFAFAGLAAGAALLAKTEMGVAALCAGIAAALVSKVDRGRAFRLALTFAACAVGTAAAVYGAFAIRVGWRTLVFDCWLPGYNLPAPLVYFNATLSGFDHPAASLWRMAIALVKLGLLGAVVGAAAYLVAGPRARKMRASVVLIAAIAAAEALALTTGLDWDRGPFLAMPFVLAGLIGWLSLRRDKTDRDRLVLLYAIFALAQLARLLLHVRSGGAYGSFVLPVSVVVFTYLWVEPFAASLPDPGARRLAVRIALALLLISTIGTAVILGYRYRRSNTVAVVSARGTMIVPPEIGPAWNEALAFIDTHTQPGDPVAVLPEGTSLVFLSGRRNPLREEIVTPGFLDSAGETRAIAALERTATRVILIVNRATREFGQESFGRDYCRTLMAWIAAHYGVCATFGAQDPRLHVGDKPFFVRAYCRRSTRT